MNDIIMRLREKDDKLAYEYAKKIGAESAVSDKYLEMIPEFSMMLTDKNSYVRTRGFGLICNQARWAKNGQIEAVFDKMSELLYDDKPTVVRQCLGALHEVIKYRSEMQNRIVQAVSKIELGKYKDSMSPLIKKDIEKLMKEISFENFIKFEEVCEEEIQLLYDMQIESFMPLYEKYHDEMSPVNESIERVRAKAFAENRRYYFIVKDGVRVGAVNIGSKLSDSEENCFYISPIFILPKYQNQGIGYAAIQTAFSLFKDIKVWKLDTILQEKGNCHLYEKCGFVRVGEEQVINDNMTLIYYEKR